MPEQLKLYRIHPSEDSLYRIGPATEGILIPGERIPSGHLPKYFAELHIVHGSKEQPAGRFVVKQYIPDADYKPEDLPLLDAKAKLDAANAELLRRGGVVVPAVVRYFVDRDNIPSHLITDLSQGGKYTVWSTHDGLNAFDRLGISDQMLPSIEQQIQENVEYANAMKFVLTERSYLLVGKTGEDTRVFVGDLDDGVENLQASFLNINDIATRNRAEAHQYLGYLKKITLEATHSTRIPEPAPAA